MYPRLFGLFDPLGHILGNILRNEWRKPVYNALYTVHILHERKLNQFQFFRKFISDAQVKGGGGVNDNLLNSNFGFAQNSTSLVFEESRIQWYAQLPSCMWILQTLPHLLYDLSLKSKLVGQFDTSVKVDWYISDRAWNKENNTG